MKMRAEVVKQLRTYLEFLWLPLESMHGWQSGPDDDHTHCECCYRTICRGTPVVG